MALIVLEGPNGAGKSTQARLLVASLGKMDRDPVLLVERRDYSVHLSSAIRMIPTGAFSDRDVLEMWQRARRSIVPREAKLHTTGDIVMDRYYHSPLAASCLLDPTCLESATLVLRSILKSIPEAIPAVVVMFDVSVETAERRLSSDRRFEPNVKDAVEVYKGLGPIAGEPFVRMSAEGSIPEVHERLLEAVKPFLGERRPPC